MIASASEDGTVRLWDRETQGERRVLLHPSPVLAVACTPPGAPTSLCLTGAADGRARLWRLDGKSDKPKELADSHAGAVTAVAFSPDGKSCATGGEDREICLWDTATGKLVYRFPAGHRGAVTSMQFTPRSQLVSAGRDNTLRLWTLGRSGARLVSTFDRRSGDVAQLGVSPDGGRVLYDQGNALRLLALPDGRIDGAVQNLTRASGFATSALFSPDGRHVLTATTEGRLQLWRTPSAATRATEVRQFVGPGPVAATCAAFSPDGSFVAVGGRDRRLRVWAMPSAETKDALIAEVVLIDPAVESSTHEARIWAEVPNPDGRWLPGTTVTMVLGEE
jgi:WD40 repeat protein